MLDVMTFFVSTIISLSKKSSYWLEPLDLIASENSTFSYVDDRKNFSQGLIDTFVEKTSSNNFIRHIVFHEQPSKLKPVLQLFPSDFQQLRWDDITAKVSSLSEIQQEKFLQKIRINLCRVLKSRDQKQQNNLLSALLDFTFYSKSDNFPDFMLRATTRNDELHDGSLFELKDSKGSNISSFNSTIPTQWKSLNEITKLNGSETVAKLSSVMDFPLSKEKGYRSFNRRCFYFVRTNSQNSNIRLSVIEGSFFETMPKDLLIGETIKAIAKDHFGIELTKEIEQTFSRINDQSLIAKSRGDLRTTINGIEKRASVSPRFRIMSEVTSDGNPHLYPEIQPKTFNLVLQVSSTRKRDNQYLEKRGYLISSMHETLENLFRRSISLDRKTEVFMSKDFSVAIKEIVHNRNGLHLVFQYDFSGNKK